jgi:hypothetical protein
MKETFRDYFKEMGLTSKKVEDRLFQIYHVAARLFPEEIGDVFISQSNDEKNAVTKLDSLWIFSENYALEARQFLELDDFEIHRLRALPGFRVISENFDIMKLAVIGTPDKKGTMIVEFNLPRGGHCQLHAYGGNCKKLTGIVLEYLPEYLDDNRQVSGSRTQ